MPHNQSFRNQVTYNPSNQTNDTLSNSDFAQPNLKKKHEDSRRETVKPPKTRTLHQIHPSKKIRVHAAKKWIYDSKPKSTAAQTNSTKKQIKPIKLQNQNTKSEEIKRRAYREDPKARPCKYRYQKWRGSGSLCRRPSAAGSSAPAPRRWGGSGSPAPVSSTTSSSRRFPFIKIWWI